MTNKQVQDEVQRLSNLKDRAILDGDYEKAAQLRDQADKLMRKQWPLATQLFNMPQDQLAELIQEPLVMNMNPPLVIETVTEVDHELPGMEHLS
jgi:hypothetical protein